MTYECQSTSIDASSIRERAAYEFPSAINDHIIEKPHRNNFFTVGLKCVISTGASATCLTVQSVAGDVRAMNKQRRRLDQFWSFPVQNGPLPYF